MRPSLDFQDKGKRAESVSMDMVCLLIVLLFFGLSFGLVWLMERV